MSYRHFLYFDNFPFSNNLPVDRTESLHHKWFKKHICLSLFLVFEQRISLLISDSCSNRVSYGSILLEWYVFFDIRLCQCQTFVSRASGTSHLSPHIYAWGYRLCFESLLHILGRDASSWVAYMRAYVSIFSSLFLMRKHMSSVPVLTFISFPNSEYHLSLHAVSFSYPSSSFFA